MRTFGMPDPSLETPFPQSWQSAALALVVLFPAVTLLHRSAAGAILHLALAMALIVLLRGQSQAVIQLMARHYGVFCIAMMLPLLVNLASHLVNGHWIDAFRTTVQRLAFAPAALFLLLHVPARRLRHFQWGVLAGVVAAVAMLGWSAAGSGGRPDPSSQNLLNFTNVLIVLTVFALCTCDWTLSAWPRAERLAKACIVAVGVAGVVMTQSRGPLLALVAVLIVYGASHAAWTRRRWKIVASVLALAVALGGIWASGELRTRLVEGGAAAGAAISDLVAGNEISAGERSTAIRFELWRASWLMFLESPWLGGGDFSGRLVELNRAGQVPDWATWKGNYEAFTQPHNDVANALANNGLGGLAALLALYFVPLGYFLRVRHHPEPTVRVAAQMGILFCTSLILCGLTVSLFTSSLVAGFYSLCVATLLAMCRPAVAGAAGSSSRRPASLPGGVKVRP